MRKSLFSVLGTAAALGAALLTTTAASAAPQARAAPAAPCATDLISPSCDTTVTFTVGSGILAITGPDAATLTLTGNVLGTILPGSPISGAVGPVTVSDNRAELAPTWTASAASTDFTNLTFPAAAHIPVGIVTYTPGAITGHTGTITATPQTPFLLSTDASSTVVGTVGNGDNSATWAPTESLTVPAQAVGGAYTSTLTESVL